MKRMRGKKTTKREWWEKIKGDVMEKSYIEEGFLAFIAMVINCASEIWGGGRDSERIRMAVDAAKEISGRTDLKGDEIWAILAKRFEGSQTPGN